MDLLDLFGRFLDKKVKDTHTMPSFLFWQSIKVVFETILALRNGTEGIFFVIGKLKTDFLLTLLGVRIGMNGSGCQVRFDFDCCLHFN